MTISKERLTEIKAIRDEDIDTSDIPELDDDFFKTGRVVMPAKAKINQDRESVLDQLVADAQQNDMGYGDK